MAKRKTSRKVNRTKVSNIRRVATTKVDNKLSILLIVLALLVFALAAISMSSTGSQQTVVSPVKVTASPTVKPTVKPVVKATVKPATTVKTTK